MTPEMIAYGLAAKTLFHNTAPEKKPDREDATERKGVQKFLYSIKTRISKTLEEKLINNPSMILDIINDPNAIFVKMGEKLSMSRQQIYRIREELLRSEKVNNIRTKLRPRNA